MVNIIKLNEKTLIFNGLKEGEMLVMQPLINVLEGTLVERLGEEQTDPERKGDTSVMESRDEFQPERSAAGEHKEKRRRKMQNTEKKEENPVV
jgi:hypothetical protein